MLERRNAPHVIGTMVGDLDGTVLAISGCTSFTVLTFQSASTRSGACSWGEAHSIKPTVFSVISQSSSWRDGLPRPCLTRDSNVWPSEVLTRTNPHSGPMLAFSSTFTKRDN